MGEAKHTPGPWNFDPDSGDISAHGGLVAETYNSDYTLAQDDRNGRLIAAAPDLREALYRLKSEAEADGMDKRAGWDCWIAMANEALAKAEASPNA